eukprot:3320671-Rhodomonas_salina.1
MSLSFYAPSPAYPATPLLYAVSGTAMHPSVLAPYRPTTTHPSVLLPRTLVSYLTPYRPTRPLYAVRYCSTYCPSALRDARCRDRGYCTTMYWDGILRYHAAAGGGSGGSTAGRRPWPTLAHRVPGT